MARVTPSGLVSNIAGKVGGSVFQRSQGGLILRNQSGVLKRNTTRSNTHKIGIARIQNDWRSLSDTQRSLWESYSIFLDRRQKHNINLVINGHQLFLRYNSMRYDMQNYSALFVPYFLTNPTITPSPAIPVVLTVQRISNTLIVTLEETLNPALQVIFIYISQPLLGSQISGNQKMVLMKQATPSSASVDITTGYEDVFSRLPVAGGFVQLKCCVWSSVTNSPSLFSFGRFLVTP